RFLRFEPLERRQILEDTRAAMSPEAAADLLARYDAQRRRVRHLFRFRDRTTLKLSWSKHWATHAAFRARFIEVKSVQAARAKKPVGDDFTYGVYRWMSFAIHGGPLSLSEVVSNSAGRPIASRQPESAWDAHTASVAIGTLLTIKAVAEESR